MALHRVKEEIIPKKNKNKLLFKINSNQKKKGNLKLSTPIFTIIRGLHILADLTKKLYRTMQFCVNCLQVIKTGGSSLCGGGCWMVGEGPGGGARILKPLPVPRAATNACVSLREQVWGWLVRAAVSVSHSSRAVFTKSITCFTTLL